ncbi:hypothetical protein [Streptomyces sp. AF1A]|jgi:hypothetical protein|uniref:hypothetical protein n=1 Tax=Streptomyces sp. AF1A TaxID=3394350 RepID=UPI0039BC7C9B
MGISFRTRRRELAAVLLGACAAAVLAAGGAQAAPRHTDTAADAGVTVSTGTQGLSLTALLTTPCDDRWT